MNLRLVILIAWSALGCRLGLAQDASVDREWEKRQNFGLKMGIGLNSMYGGELRNPRPLLGYQTGFFWHGDATLKRKWDPQLGLDLRLRGSNFANARPTDTVINSAYTRISLISLDAPVLINIRLKPKVKDQYRCFQVGAVTSLNFRSVIFKGPNRIPAQADIFLDQWENLPLKPIETALHLGYQTRGNSTGIQWSLNVGINDLNDNFALEGLAPVTGNGLRISTWALQFGLLF
ncbi:MAG: hypothetical protein O3C22_02905 [Bacteroidetes bacterium]|nr:hypothetical protein [Bacteroidota bacterium]MDA0943232.1 hypothetical protein [Bacteroidota bacterium]MDA1111179.1 hypothetical protein [Bacteroidota bacterium]